MWQNIYYTSSNIFTTRPFESKIFASPTLCVHPYPWIDMSLTPLMAPQVPCYMQFVPTLQQRGRTSRKRGAHAWLLLFSRGDRRQCVSACSQYPAHATYLAPKHLRHLEPLQLPNRDLLLLTPPPSLVLSPH